MVDGEERTWQREYRRNWQAFLLMLLLLLNCLAVARMLHLNFIVRCDTWFLGSLANVLLFLFLFSFLSRPKIHLWDDHVILIATGCNWPCSSRNGQFPFSLLDHPLSLLTTTVILISCLFWKTSVSVQLSQSEKVMII